MRNVRKDNVEHSRRKDLLNEQKSKRVKIIIGIIVILAIPVAIYILANLTIFESELEKTNVKYLEGIKLEITDETVEDFKYKLTYIENGEDLSIDGTAEKNLIFTAKTKINEEEKIFVRTIEGIELKNVEDEESKEDEDNEEDLNAKEEIDFNGEYIEEPVYIDIEKYTDIFKTEEMEEDVEELIGEENFTKFKETVFGALFEDYDYDLDGKIYEITLSEKGRAVIIITVDEKMYIAYSDNKIVEYYTNDSEYKTVIPNKIKVWMEQQSK